jgi:Uma2 family endonuclease
MRPAQPDEHGVLRAVPDFIGEVLSASTARYDTGPKRDAYFKAGVTHYWLIDPAYKTLTVLEKGDRATGRRRLPPRLPALGAHPS